MCINYTFSQKIYYIFEIEALELPLFLKKYTYH